MLLTFGDGLSDLQEEVTHLSFHFIPVHVHNSPEYFVITFVLRLTL